MASCFFLLKQFEDVLIYLNSVKVRHISVFGLEAEALKTSASNIYLASLQSYFYNDDSFNFNYAQAKAALGNYKEAEEVQNNCASVNMI